MGGSGPDVQVEDRQGSGSAMSSDRLAPEATVKLLTSCILIVEIMSMWHHVRFKNVIGL